MSYVIDQKNCTCCHRCRVECPADAIRFKNAKYWINPDKCVECGHCVEVCHNSCISNPEKPTSAPARHERLHKQCDLVVVGGGAAGLAAAARAAASGKKVILLEKNHECGGSAWYAHMLRVHYSQWHKAAGCDDKREKICRQFVKKTGGRVDPDLISNILKVNSEFIDWLISDYDLGKDYKFVEHGPFGQPGIVSTYFEPYNAKRIDTTIGPGGTGWYMCRKLQGILEQNGGEVLLNTAGQELLLDEAGAVRGVVGRDLGGEVEIACRACVVAAGAFTRSKEIMDKMQPLFYQDEGNEPVHIFTCSTCTGDGISMCEKIGADIDYVNRRVNLFGPARHPYPCCSLSISRGGPGDVKVNAKGELLDLPMMMDEISPLTFQPGRYCWSILDDAMAESNINNAMGAEKDVVGIDLERSYAHWRETLAEEAEVGAVVIADTLEELGRKLGFDPDKFAAMIREQNDKPAAPMGPPPGGDRDEDDDEPGMFEGMPPMPPRMPIQKAPFYALKLKLFHENAVGGMVIDAKTEVMKQGKPIPGLFAAGDNTRGIMLPGAIGVQYIESVISALTYAFNSGYLAGLEAVKVC